MCSYLILGFFYFSPLVVESVEPDHPSKGKKSDHSVPILYPLDNYSIQEKTTYTERTTRPLPDSGIQRFGQLMTSEDWEGVNSEDSPTEHNKALQAMLGRMLEDALPTKTVKLRNADKPFITKEN